VGSIPQTISAVSDGLNRNRRHVVPVADAGKDTHQALATKAVSVKRHSAYHSFDIRERDQHVRGGASEAGVRRDKIFHASFREPPRCSIARSARQQLPITDGAQIKKVPVEGREWISPPLCCLTKSPPAQSRED
jgi:hypothetical protein